MKMNLQKQSILRSCFFFLIGLLGSIASFFAPTKAEAYNNAVCNISLNLMQQTLSCLLNLRFNSSQFVVVSLPVGRGTVYGGACPTLGSPVYVQYCSGVTATSCSCY
jgi:hypothetical protein